MYIHRSKIGESNEQVMNDSNEIPKLLIMFRRYYTSRYLYSRIFTKRFRQHLYS